MKPEFASIREMVETQGRRYPDRIAIRFYERDITYRELDEQSSRVANGLLKLGVEKGDRVCLLMDNSPEFYYVYFGIVKAGGVAGPVNCWWQTAEIRYLLKDSGAVALFCDHNYRGLVDQIIGDTPDLQHVIEREAADNRFLPFEKMLTEPADPVGTEISPDDISTIVYTSGTTGNPKGVLLTHRNILTNSWQASLLA
ncbi:MAG TPA: class I adenylate-forming enzyme family protein, partial [Smithellaceae bacterium]|nr:class I adenylate-forming enzyme family protein [Smithellaceae bacterium]